MVLRSLIPIPTLLFWGPTGKMVAFSFQIDALRNVMHSPPSPKAPDLYGFLLGISGTPDGSLRFDVREGPPICSRPPSAPPFFAFAPLSTCTLTTRTSLDEPYGHAYFYFCRTALQRPRGAVSVGKGGRISTMPRKLSERLIGPLFYIRQQLLSSNPQISTFFAVLYADKGLFPSPGRPAFFHK